MLHLFKHDNVKSKLHGKFDIADVEKGQYIWGTSPQGYDKKSECLKVLRSILKKVHNGEHITFQDDTLRTPRVFRISTGYKPVLSTEMTVDRYVPGSKK